MSRTIWNLVGAVALVWLSLATTAVAQFETANRAFHSGTAFPLQGRHLTVACESCHLKGVYKGTPTTCSDCHWVRRRDDRFETRLGTQCEQCHTPTAWSAVRWNHAAATGVALNAAHRTIGCESCHARADFRAAAVTCVACHQADYQRTRTPNHAAAGFPTACETCHRPADATFTQAVFDHSRFPLVGSHATVDCASCHRNNVYMGTPRDCVGCHRALYDRTANPPHAAAGFPTTCETCHRATDPSWRNGGTGGFNHNTVFQLVGNHATAACATCHVNNVYRGTPRDCVGCHRALYDRTTSPAHAAAGFPTTCETCHRPTDPSWRNGGTGGFSHNTVFPLVGNHATAACATCHVNNVYRGTPRDCVGCHRALYDRTTSPPHAPPASRPPARPATGPTDPSWRNGGTGGFSHNTVFPLVGNHATAACATCHVNNVYRGTPRDCVGCHRALYDRTANPPHVAAGFPTTCETCHRATEPNWRGATFNHASVFALVGNHATAACATCHVNNVYRGTPRDCVGCHRALYTRTTNPPHAAAGFPTTCETCHRATEPNWRGATFNHATVFALVGNHATAACATCHVNNVYRGTPRDCVGCHRALYDRTTTPPHAAAGFSTTCDTCHRPTDPTWRGATFNHATVFALQGVHATTACASCHVNNVYRGTPRECVGCHRARYDATRNPNHLAAGFPTGCESCHRATDTTWTQGRFTHRFPLSGPHNRPCAECHTTPNNFQVFACTACHGRSETDRHHREVGAYRYDSLACYSCHPNGRN